MYLDDLAIFITIIGLLWDRGQALTLTSAGVSTGLGLVVLGWLLRVGEGVGILRVGVSAVGRPLLRGQIAILQDLARPFALAEQRYQV